MQIETNRTKEEAETQTLRANQQVADLTAQVERLQQELQATSENQQQLQSHAQSLAEVRGKFEARRSL